MHPLLLKVKNHPLPAQPAPSYRRIDILTLKTSARLTF